MKSSWHKYISSLFLTKRFYIALSICAVLLFVRFFVHWLGVLPFVFTAALAVIFLLDYLFLFNNDKGITATRSHAERLSNGDENPISIRLESFYGFPIHIEIIDEIPHQFQRRDLLFKISLETQGVGIVDYSLRPVKRGVYSFGNINIYARGPIGLVMRRFRQDGAKEVSIYPSYLQMRRYQLMATHDRMSEAGIKKMRRIGHSMEFEQIKEYVSGDNYRTLNWKATARRGQLMVNHFTEEKSQQIYCVIDKGRVMKMPFNGLSLLDYAVNASLVLSNVALLKHDKAGLVTFAEKAGSMIMADKKMVQMQLILESLYGQKTRYLESDFERLYIQIRTRINQRSLIVLFTNFESRSSLDRQLPYLRKIAQTHLLLVVFFENTELKKITEAGAQDVEAIYLKTIAEKFIFEKKLIVKELQKFGILSILTAPENVTVNTLNKYLELKARQAI